MRSIDRSADQPASAPNDGLGLTEVWGYGFGLPSAGSGSFHLDQVRLEADIPIYHIYLPLIARQGQTRWHAFPTERLIAGKTWPIRRWGWPFTRRPSSPPNGSPL